MRGRRAVPGAVLLAAVMLAGCSGNTAYKPNLPPETTLFVQFNAADTVNHTVPYQAHLYWLGSDVDGFVSAFEIRFKDPARPTDTLWVRTTKTDSLIDVPTPNGISMPTFQVRAIDDHGEVDPTPAQQDFSFKNEKPVIRITNPLSVSDTSFATITLKWLAVDPDGDASRLKVRVWLLGNEASARIVDNGGVATFTIPSADFLQGGKYRSGLRRAIVQAIDPGGMASDTVGTSWYVKRPCPDSTLQRGRLLIIDDVPGATPAIRRTDTLWVNSAARNLPPGSFSVVSYETTRPLPFRSQEDLRQTLEQFDAVFWYRGFSTQTLPNASGISTVMRNYEDAIGSYLDNGGTMLLEGLSMVDDPNTGGSLHNDFFIRYFGCDSLRTHIEVQGSSPPADWTINTGAVLRSSLYPSTLHQSQILNGVRVLAVRDTHDVALWALPGGLSPSLATEEPIAVRALQPAGGQAILIGTALFPADGSPPSGQAARFLDRVYEQLPPPRPVFRFRSRP
jgi:hypothetical protein